MQTALLLVARIALTAVNGCSVASGGTLTAMVGWNIYDWEATPMAFQLRRRP